jgi:hypothetical protein
MTITERVQGARPSRVRQAASFSLWSPVVAILIRVSSQPIRIVAPAAVESVIGRIVGAAQLAVLLAGLVCGVVALASACRNHTKGIMARAVPGIVINALILVSVAWFFHGSLWEKVRRLGAGHDGQGVAGLHRRVEASQVANVLVIQEDLHES